MTDTRAQTGSAAPVLFEERDTSNGLRIGFALLNRPKQINALDLTMCRLLLDRLRDWAADESIACVAIQGAGDKGFCAGGDVSAVVRSVRAGGPQRFVYGDAFFEAEYRLDRMVHEYPKPLVTWAHGNTMGGGLGLAVGGSHKIVSEQSRLAMPEIHIGLFADVGAGWFLNRMPVGAGLLTALTGAILDEADALYTGLADWYLPTAQREPFWQAMAALPWTRDARRDRALVGTLLARHSAQATDRAATLGQSALQARAGTIREIGMQPDVLSVRDALERAAERDPWFEPLAANLRGGSPTSAHVGFEHLRRTRRMSLAQTLDLDLVLAKAFQRGHDFSEGVRALLIDKDRTPRWVPSSLENVAFEAVDRHFAVERST